jgi:hypothetical protein
LIGLAMEIDWAHPLTWLLIAWLAVVVMRRLLR